MENNSDSRKADFLASTFALLVVSWLVYICRLYTRLWIIRCFFLEDYFITVAMAALTVFAAMVPVQTSHGGGKHIVNVADPLYDLPRWGKAFFIAQIFYLLTLWFVKVSVAFLLLRFTTAAPIVWTLRCTAAIISAFTIGFIFWVTFMCDPVQSQWDPSIKGTCASREAYTISVYALSAMSAITDIIMAAVPVFILRRLKIDLRTKCYAGFTMGLGTLACIATLVRFKYIRDFSISEDLTYNMVPLSICSFIEVSFGCICASLATLRPLLQQFGIAKSSIGASREQEVNPRDVQDARDRYAVHFELIGSLKDRAELA